ncbi:hypothetical protein LB503_008316, partial [Fusarium chuoi]
IWKSPFWAYKTVAPPRLLRRETRETARHRTGQDRPGRNIYCASELSSFKPNLRLNFVLAPSGSQKSMFGIRMWPYEIVSSCHCETRAIWLWMGHVRVHAVSPRSFTRLEKLVLENVGGKSKYLKSLYLPRWTIDVFGQDKSKLRGEPLLLSISISSISAGPISDILSLVYGFNHSLTVQQCTHPGRYGNMPSITGRNWTRVHAGFWNVIDHVSVWGKMKPEDFPSSDPHASRKIDAHSR